MRRAVLALALLLSIGVAASAQERPADVAAADAAAIERVISSQIEAFRRDDEDRAFSFASPGIQAMFLTSERFMAMVRAGYAPVYRPRDVRFAQLAWVDEVLVQFVALIGPDGAPVMAAYAMERQADGSWRIGGCQLLRLPGEST